MQKITIVGLGNGPGDLTLAGLQALEGARQLVLRTGRHDTAAWLTDRGMAFTTLDSLYDEAEDFEDLAARAAELLSDMSQTGPVVYAVPGDGALFDGTVEALLARPELSVSVIPGVSAAAAALSTAGGLAPRRGALLLAAAAELDALRIDGRTPLLVTQLNDPLAAGDVKLKLSAVYGDGAPCVFLTPGKARAIRLHELDRQPAIDHDSCVFISGREDSAPLTFDDLTDIMARLRAPGGCAWDREQTHHSLRRFLLEECYEALDAMERQDPAALRDELGDLLMQVVFHSQIAAERGDFDSLAVTDSICRKMLRRHPHVFGDGTASTPEEVSAHWDRIKREDRGHERVSQTLEDVPRTLTALMRAEKLLSRAARGGWVWPGPDNASGPEEALGQRLLDEVARAAACGLYPELALLNACDRFVARFKAMEDMALEAGTPLHTLTEAQQRALWRAAGAKTG